MRTLYGSTLLLPADNESISSHGFKWGERGFLSADNGVKCGIFPADGTGLSQNYEDFTTEDAAFFAGLRKGTPI
jgi:hypothetical protein